MPSSAYTSYVGIGRFNQKLFKCGASCIEEYKMPTKATISRENTKINLQVPKDLLREIDEYAAEASRNRSSIIREAMVSFLEDMKRKELEKLLLEGYEATAELSLKIHREFEHADRKLDWDN